MRCGAKDTESDLSVPSFKIRTLTLNFYNLTDVPICRSVSFSTLNIRLNSGQVKL